ncbi:hypothetical protein DIE06_34380 [Burkholderia sp. Bp8998]|nr:hypothetical protein DIE06_34380 [Burkholderia sp. Bp8998]
MTAVSSMPFFAVAPAPDSCEVAKSSGIGVPSVGVYVALPPVIVSVPTQVVGRMKPIELAAGGS